MDEGVKVKINNLISLRQSLLNLLPILVGGTLGMFFIDGHNTLRITLIAFGILFTVVIAKGLIETITEINKTLYRKGGTKWKKQ